MTPKHGHLRGSFGRADGRRAQGAGGKNTGQREQLGVRPWWRERTPGERFSRSTGRRVCPCSDRPTPCGSADGGEPRRRVVRVVVLTRF